MKHLPLLAQLRADHARVLASLDSLERETPALAPGGAARAGARRALVTGPLARLVVRLRRQFDTHMAAEDESLYPSLAAALPETRAGLEPLSAEHAELREILASLTRELALAPSPARDERIVVQWRDFAALLRIHIRKEEALVFHVAERALPPSELARVEAIRFPRRGQVSPPPRTERPKGGSPMKRIWHRLALVLLALTLASCGAKPADDSSAASAAPAKSGSSVASVSKYDSGPRAAETPRNEALAEKGEQLFKDKGCSACHGFGQRLTGPDLAGVSMRRTAAWLENQILHPDVMVKEDPISRGLFAQFALQMPNQGLTPDEARAVIEYFKHHDHEAGEKRAESH